MKEKRIQILDCTLRDGGLKLQDEAFGEDYPHFSPEDTAEMITLFQQSRVDILELGSMMPSSEDLRQFGTYQGIEDISKVMPRDDNGQMYAALYRGPDTPIEMIPDWRPGYCRAVRVILRYSELRKSLDFCRSLAKKGYQVFIQPALTMRYTEEELQMLIDTANEISAYALYVVDSFGYMQSWDVTRLFDRFDMGLNDSIKIGFHPHNNMNLAYSNTLKVFEIPTERKIIIDSCVLGCGRSAGNLQSEIIIDHMNNYYGYNYNYGAILDVCEIMEKFWTENLWGYSVMDLLPALRGAAYKYSEFFRKDCDLRYSEIEKLLSGLSGEMRHRFIRDHAIKMLKTHGYSFE